MDIYARGKTVEKQVDGELKKITPVVVGGGNDDNLGVGYTEENTNDTRYWGLLFPQDIVTAWRAMKILQKAPKIEEGTLRQCYYAATDNVWGEDLEGVRDLARNFDPDSLAMLPEDYKGGGIAGAFVYARREKSDFDLLRKSICESFPPENEVAYMLKVALRNNNTDIAAGMIEHMEVGNIPLVQQISPLLDLYQQQALLPESSFEGLPSLLGRGI